MEGSDNLGNLKTERWEQLQEIADRFEQAWETSKGEDLPTLAEFLPKDEDPLRVAALHELIKTDLEIRWRRQIETPLDIYLERFPDLGTPDSVSPQLIYEEFRVRHLYGDRPDLEAYRERFPGRYDDLARLVKDQPLPTMATPAPTPSFRQMDATRASEPKTGDITPPASDLSSLGNDATTRGSNFLDNYKPIRKIGAGGFGEVWIYEAPGGVPAAVKKIFRSFDHEESQRELESLELIKTLRHPYLLATQSFVQADDRLFIVMELADCSLRDRLKDCRKAGQKGIPAVELIKYFRETAEALDYLHSKHVLHRDIKPDNILLMEHHVKLADFGLARLHQSERSLNASGSGTPAYMPPEVWRGKVSPASDQYSLALTYVELRLDRRVFESRDMLELMTDHLERMPDLSALPEAEQVVLLKALAKDHSQRHPNCREFIDDLEEALAPELGRHTGHTAKLSRNKPTDIKSANDLTLSKGAGSLPPSAPGTEALSGSARNPASQTDLYSTVAKPTVPHQGNRPPSWKQQTNEELLLDPRSAADSRRKIQKIILAAVLFLAFAGMGAVIMSVWQRSKPWLPADGQAPPDAQIVDVDGLPYYDKIDVVKDGVSIRFLLIPKKRVDDPPTFYIMRDKVTVGPFKKFAEGRPLHDDNWKRGAKALDKDLKIENDNIPVYRVYIEDAYHFALSLGGNLPTVKQWDKAAGRFEPEAGPGPYTGTFDYEKESERGKIAVGRYEDGPMEAGAAPNDVSHFGVRDMAGNGFEWTRELFAPAGSVNATVPLNRSPDRVRDRVLVRGEGYAQRPEPLSFASLDKKEENITPDTRAYIEVDPEVSFRVVLEVPKR